MNGTRPRDLLARGFTGERRTHTLVALGLFAIVLAGYVETMAGSVSFWDCGEFIATSYIMGIPHPPATPLYVVLGRVFTLLPLPMTVAQKVNFMSSLFGALGVVMLFLIIVELIEERRGKPGSGLDRIVVYGSGLAGALFTAWSNTYWSNAVEAEVYGIAAFVMGLTTWLALRWSRQAENPSSARYIYLIIYLLSLGVGFHLGTVLTYPAIALYMLLFRKKSFQDADVVVFSFGFFLFLFHVNLKWPTDGLLLFAFLIFLVAVGVRYSGKHRFAAVAAGLFVLGISIHLFLLIRSAQQPGIDEADPQNWGNLLRVLRREQYPPGNIFARKGSWTFQIIGHYWHYFTGQYELAKGAAHWVNGRRLAYIPIVMGALGMYSMLRTSFRNFLLFFITFSICGAFLIVVLNFSDGTRGVQPEVRDRDYFYSGAFYFYGVFIGVGAAALLDLFFGGGRIRGAPGAAKGGSEAGSGVPLLDHVGYVAGIGLFLVLTCMLWNRYHFEHDRSHERVPWGYGYNMFAGLEPNALIFTNGDNDTFPLWYQQEVEHYRRDVRVLNLSLLNTDWYIRQLRDNEPKVDISWTDEQITDLHGIQEGNRIYQPRDLAVADIIHENFGKRPIYFAVTIPRESLLDYEEHLVLEGLVYRLTTQKGKDMRDFAKLEENVARVYKFDGILRPDGKRDDSVYRDSNQQSLIQNYAGAFVRLGQHTEELAEAAKDPATRQQQSDRAVHYYKQALEISPDFDALIVQLGNLYLKLAQTDAAEKMYEDLLQRNPGDERWRYKLAEAYLEAGRRDEGMRLLQGLAQDDPDNDYVRQYMIQAYHELGKGAEADKVLGEWEARHPGDKKMREFYGYVMQGLTGHLWGAGGVTRQPPQTMPRSEVVDSGTTRP